MATVLYRRLKDQGSRSSYDAVRRFLYRRLATQGIAANKTLQEFKAAVVHHQRRVEQRKKLDTIPKLEAEQRDIRKQMEKADAVLAEAETKHEATVGPFRARLHSIKQDMIEAER